MTRPPGTDYASLGDQEQIEVLRPVAEAAALEFGLDLADLSLVAHAFNTTFAATTVAGERFALRVNTNSQSGPRHIVAQQEWQVAILAQTEIVVPKPLRTRHGHWFAEIDCHLLDQPLRVTAATWLEGPDASGQMPAAAARALGTTMAQLHRQALGWTIPSGGGLSRFDRPLMGDDDRLAAVPGVSAAQRHVIETARQVCTSTFERLHDGADLQVLHADLHGGNLKWHDGRLAVFDFDDCGLGLPELDLAITTFYLRGEDPRLEPALHEGYSQVRPLPHVDHVDFEALVAARQLLLLNSLLLSTTAELRSMVATYLPLSVERLEHWLETGRFTRAVGN